MERWEMLNRVLMPADHAVGAGLDLLKSCGLYDPMREGLFKVLHAALETQFKVRNDLQVLGEEHIPEGGCLIAANHQSWLDVQVLAGGTKRRLYFVAKAEFKEWPLLRRMIELTEGIWVRRGGDPQGLQEIEDAVRAGKAVVIFPEGTIPGEEDVPRWEVEKDTGLLRGRSGVVRVALATGAPIVPCGISGTGRAWPPEAYPRLQVFPPLPGNDPITVRFGKPLRFAPGDHPSTREELAQMTKQVMLAISRLVDHQQAYEPVTLPIPEKTEPSAPPRLAYSRSPRGANGHKAPFGVLVIHGFTSDIHCVDPLVAPLDGEGMPYRFPVLRGHGTHYEDMEGTGSSDWYEDAENALLDLYREVQQVAVVGHSMGGVVALELAARHRSKICGVVPIAPALRFVDPLAALTPALASVVRFWPSPNAYRDPELKARENRNYPKFATSAFVSLRRYGLDMTNLLSFVKAPTVVLQSHADTVVAPKSARLVLQKVSAKERRAVWFEKSGHEMLLDCEAPAVIEAVMGTLREWRDRLGR